MLYSLDRFEGEWAVLVNEDDECLNVMRTELPADAAEGDMFRRTDDGFMPDAEATAERRARILALQERLRRRL